MVWKWWCDPSGGLEVVGRTFRRSGCGREALLEVRKCLRDPPGVPEVVRIPSQWFGRVGETLPVVRKW